MKRLVVRFGALLRLIALPMTMVLTPLMALADTEYVNGRTWTYTISGTAAVVTGVNPSAGVLIIPEYLGGTQVRVVAASSFKGRKDIESVVFPSNLTRIEESAFYGCEKLVNVSFPNALKTIGASAFRSCKGLFEVYFPDSVETIGGSVFADCNNIYGVSLPRSSFLSSDWIGECFKGSKITKIFIPQEWLWDGLGVLLGYGGTSNFTDLYLETSSCPGWGLDLEASIFTVHAPWKDGSSTSYYDFEYWEPIYYTTYFDANGGSVYQESKSYPAGIPYGALPVPWKEGCKFDGRYTSSYGGSKVTGQDNATYYSRTLYAHWSQPPVPLTVTFNANGGSGTMSSQTISSGGSAILKSSSFSRSGYSFVGWGEYNGECDEVWLTYRAGDRIYADDYSGSLTLYAVWAKNNITVTFDAAGGSVYPGTMTVSFGSSITLPTPVRNGYEFRGWANGCAIFKAGKQYTYDGMDCENDDFTFMAFWDELWPSSYLTSFSAADLDVEWYEPVPVLMDPGGAPGSRRLYFITDEYDEDFLSKIPDCPYARQGYSFAGWDYYDGCSSGRSFEFSGIDIGGYRGVIQAGDKVEICGASALVATWRANSYTVTFNANGGSCSETSRSRDHGSTLGSLPTPNRTGYSFAGWFTSSSGGSQVSSSTTVSGNVTYYAHWTANTYTLTFNATGGSVSPTSRSVTYDSTYGSLPTPSKDHSRFLGWFTSSSGGTQVSSSTRVTGNVTVYAHWEAQKFTLTFDANGGSCSQSSSSVSYGSAYGSLPTPTRTGYTFSGWYTLRSGGSPVYASTTMTGEGATVYAHWTANAYTVTLDRQGGSGGNGAVTVTYEQPMPTITLPSRDGYAFAGYFSAAEGAGTQYYSASGAGVCSWDRAETATLYAKWTRIPRTVTFDVNDGTGKRSSVTVYHGDACTEYATPTREGYIFTGWYATKTGHERYDKASPVTADITLYAQWIEDAFTTEWMDGLVIDISSGTRKVHTKQALTMDPQWVVGGAHAVVAVNGETVERSDVSANCEWAAEAEGVYVVSHQVLDVNGNPTGESYSAKLQWVVNSAVVVDDGSGNPIPCEYRVGETLELPSKGNKPGYDLVGWSDGKQVYAPGSKYVVTADDVRFTAVYVMASLWPVDEAFSAVAANVYDGILWDGENLVGLVQVKTAKQSVKTTTDKVTKEKTVTTNITATATVTDANGKKWSYSKGNVELAGSGTSGEDTASPLVGVVTGLKCTTKGCPVAEFGVMLGKNGLEGEWDAYEILGARNGMGVKGDEMMSALEAYKGKWSVTLFVGEDADRTVRLQLNVGAKGVVKVAGNWESGAKVSASAQMLMGDGFVYVPVMVKATKTSPALNALVRIAADGEVALVGADELVAGGLTVDALGAPTYEPSAVSKGGAAFRARVAVDELAYPAKFAAKGLPSGLKIDAATGVISGTPTKPGHYVATVTVTSGLNSKVKETLTVEFDIANYTDEAIPVEDAYGPYRVGVAVETVIPKTAGCKVSGLPAGLKWTEKDIYDKSGNLVHAAGTVYGVPTKMGTFTVYFKLARKETVDGKLKSVTRQASATFTVEDLDSWAQGTFNGGSEAGLVTLTVGKTGKLSGKWLSEGLTWTLTAASFDAYISSEQMYIATVIGKSGKLAMTNEIVVTEGGVTGLAAPQGGDVSGTVLFEAWRNGWKEEPLKTAAKALKNLKVQVGEVLLTVGSSGAVTAKGTFVTGFDEKKQKNITYSASCSTVLIPMEVDAAGIGSYAVYLYFPPKTGKFDGYVERVVLHWNGAALVQM